MRKKVNKKLIVALLSFVLLFGGTFGSSLAWLLDNTTPVENTFSTSDIGVDLVETTEDYKIIPGWTVPKDPKVSVTADSVACYVFVKIEKSDNYSTYLEEYQVDSAWTQLVDTSNVAVEGVYWQKLTAEQAKNGWNDYVLASEHIDGDCTDPDECTCPNRNGYVTVLGSVTKEQMETLKNATADKDKLTLTFTAYASQLMKNNTEMFDPYIAWENLGN